MIIDKIKAKFSRVNPNLDKPIEELGLSTRTYNKLKRAGIETVKDLTELTWRDIAGFRGMVLKSCNEVEQVLKGLGLELRKEDN